VERAKAVVDDVHEIEVGGDSGERWDFDKSINAAIQGDPFARNAEELRDLNGFSPTFKKKLSREITKFQRGSGAATKQKDEYADYAYFKLDVAPPPYNLDYLGKLYEINPAHKAAVDAKVANIVGLGFDLVESFKMQQQLQDLTGKTAKLDKIRKKIDEAKNTVHEWVDSLNEDATFLETLRRMWTDVETTGNGYLEIGRKVTGEIGYLGHVPASTIRVRTRRDGYVQMTGTKATFFRNYGDQETKNPFGDDPRPNEIIHFKKYSPNNSFYGVPDIIAAKNALAGAEFASRYNLDYFEHKAVPRYIIVVKGATLSPASEQRLVDFFQTGLKGKNHRSLYVPLPSVANADVSFEMNPVEADVQEASFGGFIRECRIEVLMAHRTPSSKVGLSDGEALAAAKDADKTFKEQVCRPEQDIINKKVGKIFQEVTDALRFKLRELTLTDEVEQAKIDEIYLRMQTDLPNEIRHRRGKPGIEGGDEVVDLKAQDVAEQTAQATGSRTRDQTRQSRATDSRGSARNPQGEGRSTA
jgi:PBSX family phage portal protein